MLGNRNRTKRKVFQIDTDNQAPITETVLSTSMEVRPKISMASIYQQEMQQVLARQLWIEQSSLEDDLPAVQDSPHNLEWKRCMEGFSDFGNRNNSVHAGKVKRLRTNKSNCQSFLESSFDHVTDFGSEASGQDGTADAELISWSSSDGDSDAGELHTTKKDPPKDQKQRNKGKDVSKDNLSSSRKKQKVPKTSRLELQRFSPSFDCLEGVESDDEIDTICCSSGEEMDHGPEDLKPCTSLADLPRQTSPIKKSRLHSNTACMNSPAIGSYQSGRSSSSESPGTSGLKASDWVKGIDWQTPVKSGSQDDGEIGVEPDSAKKKRIKYKKDGLASQLCKLQARERTAVRIWEHQKTDEIDSSSKACLVRVLRFEVLYSLQVAHCEMAKIQQSQEGGEQNSPDSVGGDWKSQIILFSKHMMEKLQMEAGTLVKIYPPWQQLKLTSLDKTVLLCTNYTRVVSSDSQAPGDNYDGVETEVSAKWSCPCTKDPTMTMEDCAVNQMPFHPSSYCSDSLHHGTQTTDQPDTQLNALHTVTMSQFPLAPVCDSLLEAIQKTSSGRSLSFRAVVQRIFFTSKDRYSLLLEDSHGTMAVAQIGEDSVIQAEGKTCIISGLRVVARSNKERNLALFSVIEGAWSGHMAALSSQESQEEDEPVPTTSARIPCPGFCYILAPAENDRFSISASSDISSSYRQPQLSPLVEAQRKQSEKRVSFLASVIHSRMTQEVDKPETLIPVWYVTDESLPSSYTMITGTTDCIVPGSTGRVALFTDVRIINGKFHADRYTLIRHEVPSCIDDDLVMEKYQQLGRLPVSLPAITSTVQQGFLVSVKGVVTSIDEEAAYSWEACDGCSSDRLVENNTGISTCASCHRRVTSPVTKLKMEVYLECAEINQRLKIKVDLLQSTVEKLLPMETQDEEGYDIDSVLHKELGPLTGVVKSVRREDGQSEICIQEVT